MLAAFLHEPVHFSKALGMREWNKYISSGQTDEVFHKPFLMALPHVAEDHLETVMSCHSCIALLSHGALAGPRLHGNARVVEDNMARNAAEEVKSLHKPFEEGFGILFSEAHGKGSTAVAKPCAEAVQLRALAVKIDENFAPVDLHGLARLERERNKDFLQVATHLADHGTDGALSSHEIHFVDKKLKNPPRRVVLLAVRLLRILL